MEDQNNQSTEKNQIPDILTLVSKEKFRRNLLIASRVLSLFLILGIAYAGFSYYQLSKVIPEHSYCYLCGYYEGKRCEQQYFQQEDYRTPQEVLLEIAQYNDIIAPRTIVTGGAIGSSLNGLINISNATISNK